MTRSVTSAAKVALIASIALIALAAVAAAQFNSTTSASSSNSTATLAPATSPAAALGTCVPNTSVTVRVSWTASTSTWADGYEVLRSATSGGPYNVVGTVSGVATTTFIDTGLTFATTYFYVVRATKAAWRSTSTAPSSYQTPTTTCV